MKPGFTEHEIQALINTALNHWWEYGIGSSVDASALAKIIEAGQVDDHSANEFRKLILSFEEQLAEIHRRCEEMTPLRQFNEQHCADLARDLHQGGEG